MSKKQLDEECLARAIDVTGLTKQEMTRRLKLHERKIQTQKEKEGCLEADVGEKEKKSENETNPTDSDERQMQITLIQAEERRFTAEAEAATRKEMTAMAEMEALMAKADAARAEADANERWARSERERLEADKQRFEMELMLMRESAQLGLVQQNSTSGGADATEIHHNSIVKLPTMHGTEDAISYFHSFEKIAHLNNVDEANWPRLLPALLNSSM